ncbi:hypothetical protein ACC720_39425, partial [Rhizobium ruizarguesonis]
DGSSQTNVMFRMEVPTEQAVQDTKYAIDRIRSDLPSVTVDWISSMPVIEATAYSISFVTCISSSAGEAPL